MIDQFFQRIAEDIQKQLSPEIGQFLIDLFQNNIFQKMTPEDLQVNIIKIFLEALAVVLLICISGKTGKKTKQKKETKNTHKAFKPKKWRTDGSYFDESKQQWINPDYK